VVTASVAPLAPVARSPATARLAELVLALPTTAVAVRSNREYYLGRFRSKWFTIVNFFSSCSCKAGGACACPPGTCRCGDKSSSSSCSCKAGGKCACPPGTCNCGKESACSCKSGGKCACPPGSCRCGDKA
jgi:hypothetical protein